MNTKLKVTLATVLALLAMPALAEDAIGVVKRSNGHVVIERDRVQISAPQGTELLKGDRIITGPDGYANISMRRAVQLNVGPDADILLDRFAAEGPFASKPAPAILKSLASFFAVNRHAKLSFPPVFAPRDFVASPRTPYSILGAPESPSRWFLRPANARMLHSAS